MIKILNKGNKANKLKSPIYRVECSNCGSILQYSKEDVHTDRDGSYIECPVCDMFINHIF